MPVTAARTVMALPLADVFIADRVGFYNEPHAEQLGVSMKADGQHDPIHVQRRGNAAKQTWALVAGLHRLRGAELAGLPTIDAVQVAEAGATPDDLRRLELSENLDHRQRRPIERSIFMAERARLEEAADHPGRVSEASYARAARARWDASASLADASAGWKERTAASCGCAVRSLERHLLLHREIVAALGDNDLVQLLNDHPLGDSMTAMLRVTQLCKRDKVEASIGRDPFGKRRRLVEFVVAHPSIASIDEAYARVFDGPSKGDRFAPDAHDERARGLWAKMTVPQRHSFAVAMAKDMPPSIAADVIASFKARGLL